ncbi:hypothetical protein ACVWXO_000603 [Bradyrhizobium sp. LM2.7]
MRQDERIGVDANSVYFGGMMRGSGRFKAVTLRNDPIGRKTAQSCDLLAIGLSFSTPA